MAAEVLYLDASALAKLVLDEPERGALRQLLAEWPARASSVVVEVELLRATRRETQGDAAAIARAEHALTLVNLIALDRPVVEAASALEPPALRALDAIHLASALSLGARLGGFAAYDRRLAEAARGAGLEVLAPA